MDTLYPDSFVDIIRPHVLLFPEIGGSVTSTLEKVKPSVALQLVLAQSSLVLLEPDLAQPHLKALRDLVTSTRHFRLIAGGDVFEDPPAFARLVESAVLD